MPLCLLCNEICIRPVECYYINLSIATSHEISALNWELNRETKFKFIFCRTVHGWWVLIIAKLSFSSLKAVEILILIFLEFFFYLKSYLILSLDSNGLSDRASNLKIVYCFCAVHYVPCSNVVWTMVFVLSVIRSSN